MTDNPFVQPAEAAGERLFLIGEVASVTGGLFVKMDGESEARTKSFKRLGSYTPAVGHRVLIAKISGTYVVLDRVV